MPESTRVRRKPAPFLQWATGLALFPAVALCETTIDEIIVTARRLPEPLSRVPLVIDAVEGSDIRAGSIDSLQALMSRAPGLYFESAWGGLFSAPTLRGQQTSPTGDVNVGVFVDGVYQANATAMDPGNLDYERVEVVRGPQSTLFGHSTFAGAIHYVSREPVASSGASLTIDTGSDGLLGANGVLNGPVFSNNVLTRLAAGVSRFDGSQINDADEGARLGGWEQQSAALTMALPRENKVSGKLAIRYLRALSAQPAASALTYVDYDCGGIEAASGAWSYYCSEAPIRESFDISTGVPDSKNETLQGVLDLSWPVGAGRFDSRTSAYSSSSDSYRDFDVTSAGEVFGVCSVDSNCFGPIGVPRTVNRLVTTNEVSRSFSTVREWSQEFRWNSPASDKLNWMLGATAWWTELQDESAFGAARGDLSGDERLTALLPQNPFEVGPISLSNAALVDDPNRQQVARSLDISERRTVALFGSVEYSFSKWILARAELRATRENRGLDNQLANFVPGFGEAIADVEFNDVTPRVTLQFLSADTLSAYVSAAKGSQSGGINPVPGLLPSEQYFEPEYNWTYELGGRLTSGDNVFALQATLYYIDWRDMQLLGFPDTQGVSSLITRNVAGLYTRGIEASFDVQPWTWFRAEAGLSYSDPRFPSGTDDPGSRRFCGISATNSTSTFCTAGPARDGNVSGLLLVPYIDGNRPPRSPQKMWHLAMIFEPAPLRADRRVDFRIDANGQGDVYDRAIDGAYFGSRTLVDARFNLAFGKWSLSLWGRNLGGVDFVRAMSSRGQVFYPTTPRPLDMIYGDGRRFGLSLSWSTG